MKFLRNFSWIPAIEPFTRNLTKSKEMKHKADIRKEGKLQYLKFLKNFEYFMNRSNFDELKIQIQRKIKKIRIFRLIKKGGRLMKQICVTNIKGFKDFYGINKTNRVVGFTPSYVGFRPARPVNFNNIIVKVINNNFDVIKNKFPGVFNSLIESLINFREVFSGSYDSNSGHLRDFFKDDETRFSAEEIIKEVKGSSWLLSPQLDVLDVKDLAYYINYNPKSNPGYFSSKIFRTKEKGYTVEPSILLAMKKFELIRTFAVKNFTLWDLFAREKDIKVDNVKEGDYSDSLTTRVVMSTEHYQTILLSYYFQQLMVSTESSGLAKYSIKKEYDGTKAYKLYEKLKEYDYVVDADWPKFDSSIDSSFLIAAGSIMFSNCILNKETRRVIFHIISSFVTKYVAVPPGIVVELNRGNPSGHPGVTAINCYVNIIRWIMIGKATYGQNFEEYMDIEVYGDDAYVFFKNKRDLIMIDQRIKELGFSEINIYERLYPTNFILSEPGCAPDFLKRKLTCDGLAWNSVKLFDKLIYQSKRRNVVEQVELIKNFILTAPGDDEMNRLLKYILENIYNKYKEKFYLSPVDEIDMFLEKVQRYKLLDKTEYKDILKQKYIVTQNKIINLERHNQQMNMVENKRFNIMELKAYFLLCENSVFLKYTRSMWKIRDNIYKILTKELDFSLIDYNNEKRAKKFLKIKLKI